MDINSWVRQVDDVLPNSRSKIVRENRFGISIGMDLLLAYLKEIAERAIELNDEKMILMDIDEAPAEDVVPVVRCRECNVFAETGMPNIVPQKTVSR